MNKLIKKVPNTITCLNLLFGCIATVFALRGWVLFAGYCIFIAAFFDFCDGLAARMLKAYSDIGKELDSLADVISFGLAPAAMLHIEMNNVLSSKITGGLNALGWELFTFLPFLITVFSALRLAKFNIDTRQTDNFLGLTTTANALLISSGLLHVTAHPVLDSIFKNIYTLSIAVALLSALLVFEIPMFSLKIKLQKSRGVFVKKYIKQFIFLAMSLILIVLFGFGGIALALLLYILISVIEWIINKIKINI